MYRHDIKNYLIKIRTAYNNSNIKQNLFGTRMTIKPPKDYEFPGPTFRIKRLKMFTKTVEEYLTAVIYSKKACTKIDEKHNIDYFINGIFKYPVKKECNNLTKHVKRLTNFLEDDEFAELRKKTKIISLKTKCDLLYNIYAHRIMAGHGLETPYIMQFSTHNNRHNNLPYIRYAISEGEAYIYSIQGLKNNKPISKELRKTFNEVNSGVGKIDKLRNINPVMYSTLIMFVKMLKERGISTLKIPVNIPNRLFTYKVDTHEEALRVDQNATVIFQKYFERLAMQIDGIEISDMKIKSGFRKVAVGNKIFSKNNRINSLLQETKLN